MKSNVLLIESSEIIKAGLQIAIKQELDVDFCIANDRIFNLASNLTRYHINIIICNTMHIEELRHELSRIEQELPYVVGLVSNIVDENIVSYFDELIYLNDPIEKLGLKLRKLLERKDLSEAKFNSELSDREREVVCLIAQGYSHKEISDMLCISTHTVVTHRKNITQKLGIKSASGLTVYAILNSLIKPESLKKMLQ